MFFNKFLYWVINIILSATAGVCSTLYFAVEQTTNQRKYRPSLIDKGYSPSEFLIYFLIGAIPTFILLCKGYKGYVQMLKRDKEN